MTMTSTYQRLYSDGIVHCPGAIQSGMQAELFATLKEFCQVTNVWQEDLDIYVSSASIIYPLTISSGKAINRLMNLYDSVDIDKKPVWPATMPVPGTLRLLRQLTNVTTPLHWLATVALYPVDPEDANGNPSVPDWIIDKHFETLFDGMLYRMFVQPGKPWTNVQLARFRLQKYAAGRGRARVDALHQNTYDAQTWNFPGTAMRSAGRQRGV